MPVIGHAFVGIVTAHGFEPGGPLNPQRLHPAARAMWLPTLVCLAYLPDVVSYIGLWAGLNSAKVAAHSMFVGVGLGLLAGGVWARTSRGPARMLCMLAVGSVLLHDVLDLLQADDRVPLWPISSVVVAPEWLAFPNRLTSELLLFGSVWLLVEVWRFHARRMMPAEQRLLPSGATWLGAVLVLPLVIGALTVEYLRSQRSGHLENAHRLVRTRDFAEALKAADAAALWPSSAGPGRVDLIRGEAYEGLGNNLLAEQFYLRAYRSDRNNFWAVADLAEFYAAHGTSAQRRLRAAPYVTELAQRFAHLTTTPPVLNRVAQLIDSAPRSSP